VSARTILVADASTIGELQGAGVIGPAFFKTTPVPLDQQGNAYICDGHEDHDMVQLWPATLPVLYEDSHGDPNALERLQELCSHLLGKLVVHIAVIGNADRCAQDLASLRRWYRCFNQSLRDNNVDQQRIAEYRHALVLVLLEPIRPEQIDDLQAALAECSPDPGEAAMRMRTYVMGYRLATGRDDALHARHIWPVSVSQLLFYLTMTKPSDEGLNGSVYAWRCHEFRIGIPGQVLASHLQDAYRYAYEQIQPRADQPTTGTEKLQGIFPPAPRLSPPDAPLAQGSTKEDWQKAKPLSELKSADERATHDAEEAARGACTDWHRLSASEFAQQATSAAESQSELAKRLWRSVHTDPARLYSSLRASPPSGYEKPAVDQSHATELAEDAIRSEDQYQKCREELEVCCGIYDQASAASVPTSMRRLLAVPPILVAAFIAFHMSQALLRLVLGGLAGADGFFGGLTWFWLTPVLAAVFAGLGAICAVGLGTAAERERGMGALQWLRKCFAHLESQSWGKHQRVLERVRDARLIHWTLFAQDTALRLEGFLARLRSVFVNELQPQALEIDVSQLSGGFLTQAGSQQAQRRRLASYARSCVGTAEALPGESMDLLNRRIEDLVKSFRSNWQEKANQLDPDCSGYLPAGCVYQWVHPFQAGLEFAVTWQMAQRARMQSGEAELSAQVRGKCGELLEHESFSYLASCALREEGLQPDRHLLVPEPWKHSAPVGKRVREHYFDDSLSALLALYVELFPVRLRDRSEISAEHPNTFMYVGKR
jgi:hypothetical protein